jgi:hypothetical protein
MECISRLNIETLWRSSARPWRTNNLSEFELKTLKFYNETYLANGFIQRSTSPADAPYTYKLQLEALARDNVPDTRDNGPAEGYFIKEKSYC